MSVRNSSINDMSRISLEIPAEVRICIADVVIAFARLEAVAEELIWAFCGLSFDNGSLLTTMDARPKFGLVQTLVEKHRVRLTNPTLPASFWTTLSDLRTHRNSVAHGQWIMVDRKIPATASYRSKDQQGSRVVSEAFSTERLEAITRQCDRCRNYLKRLIEAHENPPPKPLRQRRQS